MTHLYRKENVIWFDIEDEIIYMHILRPVLEHDEHSFRFYTIEMVSADVIFLMKLVVNFASALITVYEL